MPDFDWLFSGNFLRKNPASVRDSDCRDRYYDVRQRHRNHQFCVQYPDHFILFSSGKFLHAFPSEKGGYGGVHEKCGVKNLKFFRKRYMINGKIEISKGM